MDTPEHDQQREAADFEKLNEKGTERSNFNESLATRIKFMIGAESLIDLCSDQKLAFGIYETLCLDSQN